MEDREIRRIEQANPIVEVAVEMGLRVRGNRAPCFRSGSHPEGTEPSLFFDIARNTFLCKSCRDLGGGVIDFICQYKGWDRAQAIAWLAHRNEFDRETRSKYYSRGKKK